MIEILVTLAITAIALLGAAGLQLRALRTGQNSQFRTQAVLLAADLAERMEANPNGAINGNYVVAASSTATQTNNLCANGCTSSGIATGDLYQWQNTIPALLPQPTWTVAQTSLAGNNPATYTITISWVDRRSDTTYASAGSGETFSYTSTRTILLPQP
jgi:type IV pilus assembly protein PilV